MLYQAQYFLIGIIRPVYYEDYGALPYMVNAKFSNGSNVTIFNHTIYLKDSLYTETRPPPVCENQFGYPSAHCVTTISIFIYMALDYIISRKETLNNPVYKINDQGVRIEVD